jgi:hypothetical protein
MALALAVDAYPEVLQSRAISASWLWPRLRGPAPHLDGWDAMNAIVVVPPHTGGTSDIGIAPLAGVAHWPNWR